jgi:hypothetical protein
MFQMIISYYDFLFQLGVKTSDIEGDQFELLPFRSHIGELSVDRYPSVTLTLELGAFYHYVTDSLLTTALPHLKRLYYTHIGGLAVRGSYNKERVSLSNSASTHV